MEGTQLVMGAWVWCVLAAAVLFATRDLPRGCRQLVLVTVLASPYVLESTLWMLTDACALALSIIALSLLLRISGQSQITGVAVASCGVLIAGACAVRQTAVWLLGVAVVVLLVSRRDALTKVKLIVLIVLPSIVVLSALFVVWGGLTAPGMDAIAQGPQPLAIPVGFALWAFFGTPLLLPLWHRVTHDRLTIAGSILGGVLAAAPAVIWTSNYQPKTRSGGWLWKAVIKHGVDICDRSLALCVLAFVGGATVFLILRVLYTSRLASQSWMLGSAIYASILVTVPVYSALQKYREIPLLAIFPFLVVAVACVVASIAPWWRSLRVALVAPAALQLMAAVGTVGYPILRFLIDPASAPVPEWVE